MRLKIVFIVFILTSSFLAVFIGLRHRTLKDLLLSLPAKVFTTTQFNKKVHVTPETSETLDKFLSPLYVQLEIQQESIKRVFSPSDSLLEIAIEIPKGKPIENIIFQFSQAVKKSGYTINDCVYISDSKGCTIVASPKSSRQPKLRITLKQGKVYFSKTAKVAILVEDFKFSADQTTVDFLSFSEPLTVSMVGEKKMATWTAQIANEYHKEIVILLPMEPLSKSLSHYANSTMMVHYSDDKIRSLFNQAVDYIPNSTGFCNLSGSRILEDSRIMNLLCQEIKKMNRYLLISPESRKSAVDTIASNNGIEFREIDFTLNTAQPESILIDSLRLSAVLAQRKGTLLVKGKSGENFIKALKACLPIFNQNGVRFVYVSELFEKSDIHTTDE
jgi:polysaccharide deacetylase 2 family uncharacterized protein YibQ